MIEAVLNEKAVELQRLADELADLHVELERDTALDRSEHNLLKRTARQVQRSVDDLATLVEWKQDRERDDIGYNPRRIK